MIGVFDSGLGGLSVLAAIARALPRADLTYLADTAHVPYGAKSEAFIRGRVLAIGRHLVAEGCSALVVACNTATVAAIQALRAELHVPVVGVEPGIKPAAMESAARRIAVLATEATARSERLSRLIADHAAHVHVHVEPCPGWATRVETLDLDAPDFADDIATRIGPLLDAGVDRIVLGCTHYAFLADRIAALTKGRAELVDVADAVARQVMRVVPSADRGVANLRLLATARPERLHAALPRLGLDWLAQRAAAAQLAAIS